MNGDAHQDDVYDDPYFNNTNGKGENTENIKNRYINAYLIEM